MKTIILCGGQGTRMKEETEFKPKPMVRVGEKPILWHIMKTYAHYGFNEFVLALGYKGDMIKDFFLNQRIFTDDFTLNTATHEHVFHNDGSDDFKITFAETGIESSPASRLLQVQKYITEDDFMVTFGDGVANIDIQDLVAFHKKQGTMGTMTGVHPRSKYGLIEIDAQKKTVSRFDQKPVMHNYIAGGFMAFKKEAFKYFRPDEQMEEGLMRMTAEGQLSAYIHEGFWKAMDTYREMEEMNQIWRTEKPWAVWEKK